MIHNAQKKIRELKQVTNDYVDDSLKRTEDAIAAALGELQETRSRFPEARRPRPRTTLLRIDKPKIHSSGRSVCRMFFFKVLCQ